MSHNVISVSVSSFTQHLGGLLCPVRHKLFTIIRFDYFLYYYTITR